jgi:hypothetical protein
MLSFPTLPRHIPQEDIVLSVANSTNIGFIEDFAVSRLVCRNLAFSQLSRKANTADEGYFWS